MKWYNNDKTKCLDLASVSYWEFAAKEARAAEYGKKHPAFAEFTKPEACLSVAVAGLRVEFCGKEAEEIYNILKKQKEIL